MLTKIFYNVGGELVRVFIDLSEVAAIEKYVDDETLITLKSGKEKRLAMKVDEFLVIYNKEMKPEPRTENSFEYTHPITGSPCPG